MDRELGVIALPRELARWEADLAIFPDDLALVLGSWIGRLHLAIGPWSEVAASAGEPDGLGELSRRGPYERLLASEWLLADELPDEFLRRAVSGEHLFLSPSQKAPSANRRAIALFDAGPSQIGAPRIAHVALLVVLGRRARSAGARFGWGILQRPTAGLSDAMDASGVGTLLDARTAEEATEDHRDAWAGSLGRAPGDVWLVGGSRAVAAFGGLARGIVTIDDPVAHDRRELDVRVEDRGRRALVELALPDERAAARLLRDPFGVAAPEPGVGTVDRAAPFALPGDGRRLVVATADGFASWGLPNSPRGTTGPPRRLVIGKGEKLIAAGQRGRRLIGVSVRGTGSDSELVIHRAPWMDAKGETGTLVVPNDAGLGHRASSRGARLGHAMVNVLALDDRSLDVTFHDGASALVSVRASGLVQYVAEGVLGVTPVHDGALLVIASENETSVLVIERGEKPQRILAQHAGLTSTRALFGSCELGTGVAAFSLDALHRSYRCIERNTRISTELHAPSGSTVIGVHQDPKAGPTLVILEQDERAIGVIGRRGARASIRASARIVEAYGAARGGLVAWRTSEGFLEVGSLAHDAVVLRVPPTEETT